MGVARPCEPGAVKGGLDFKLPNGAHVGRIKKIVFNDVQVLVKGGYPAEDRNQSPPELGVGQYNVSNLKVQPAYGLWARHAENLTVTNCTFNYEERDSRYALFFDGVLGARVVSARMVRARDSGPAIGAVNSAGVIIEDSVCYEDVWGQDSTKLESSAGR